MDSSENLVVPDEGDTLARCVLHPRQISATSGVFAFEAAFDLVKSDSKSKVCTCAMSTGLVRAIGSVAEIHAYGCRSAQHSRDARSERLRQSGKVDSNPRLPHYIGFYTFVIEKLKNIQFDNASIEVVQVTENGETAHCNVMLIPNAGIDRGKWTDARTAFYNALSTIVNGPWRHICAVDEDLRESLSAINLPPVGVVTLSV